MRVKTYRADDGGVGCYRLKWASEQLAAQGYDVEDCYQQPLEMVCRDTEDGTEILSAVHPDCDVVVLQRTLRAEILDAIPHLQAIGVAVVLEVDDHFGALPRHNPAAQAMRKDGPHHVNLARACELADLVTTSTPVLAQFYGGHGRAQVIPNYCRASWLDIECPAHDGVRIGWTGVMDTHRKDHGSTLAPIRNVCADTGARFHAIGTRAVLDHYLLDEDDGHTWCGWRDLQNGDYAREIATLDIGIVPLELNKFNAGKSRLKGIEYAALGVPFVASPTPEYLDLSERYGIGLTARLPGEWRRHLERLVRSRTYREGMGGTIRERMRNLTIEGHAHEWWNAWTRALAHRRAA